MPPIDFDGSPKRKEDDYKSWVEKKENQNGYVLNVHRNPSAEYLRLHRATCRLIRNFDKQKPGAYTEMHYRKMCSNDIEDLKGWIKKNVAASSGFTPHKCYCNPPSTE